MSIYIGNNLENRLKISETENASLKKYSEYHQVIYEIDHMSGLDVDSSTYEAWFPLSQLRPQQRPISSLNKAISVKDD